MVVLWSVNACERQSASLLLWRGAPGKAAVQVAPYRCGSWRCQYCAWSVGREDYRRIEAAALSRERWMYGVLTFDPADVGSRDDAYREAGRRWDKYLRRRLERRFGRIEYMQTWERHLSGWPHMNILFRSSELYAELDKRGFERRWAKRAQRWALWSPWRRAFRRFAIDSGFGQCVWLEAIEPKNREAMAAYLTKVSHEFTSSSTKKGDQRPFEAPPHFRRVRASRELLPKRTKVSWQSTLDEATGEEKLELVERPIDKRKRCIECADLPEPCGKCLDNWGPWSGILSPKPLDSFTLHAPTWTDVADAIDYQAKAARSRQRKKALACSTH